jgi:hypothetical protein
VRRSWNEIRIKAATFARDWAGVGYEKGHTQLFYNGLFDVSRMSGRRVTNFKASVRLLDNRHGYIYLLWKGMLLVEQKSIGRDLTKVKQQAPKCYDMLTPVEMPRYLLLCNFPKVEAKRVFNR